MQVDLDVCTHSQRLMSYLDDSHFPGSQIVMRAGGFYINYLRGAFHQKHASSIIEGKWDTMNTITQAHFEGLYMQMHRNQEGGPSKNSEKWIEDTALHNPFPHLCNLKGLGD